MADVPDPEARIAALQAELTALRADMQHFTYAVSHDLRAPLRHILSYAQLVQEDAGPLLGAEVQEFLATITDSARHMGVLLDGLSALSRVGTAPVNTCAVSLQELVPGVCNALAAQHPGRAIGWHLAPDLPSVQADAALLRQALSQVLGNAVKFSAQRQPAVIEVNTAAESPGGFVTLQVRDNGVGYNPAQQDQLFKVFGRLHSSQQFEGIGMGLVLTKKIVERLGGAVCIEGEANNGCTVRLQFKSTRQD
jgi:light-regulated signal transduction histidine kinase (bacteriophytochrome)